MATIRTSHAGSLPRTPELLEANRAKQAQNTARLAGETVTDVDTERYDDLLTASVVDLVGRQRELGISLPNDGEYGHAMAPTSTTARGGTTRSPAPTASNSTTSTSGRPRRSAPSPARSA